MTPDARSPESSAPPASTWDRWLGERVFLALGLAFVVAGVAWAFKYAYDVGWWGHLPAGVRVLAGLLAGGALLGSGLRLERSADYRGIGRGLIAAGWPLLYFTVYAAHAFDASRVIVDPTLALGALCATAAAAIAFSLRYRSEWITIAGYAFGYLALWLGGMDGPALVAGATFTVSLAVLLCRFRWPWLGLTGLLGSSLTYLAWLGPALGPDGFGFARGPEAFGAGVWYPALTWAAYAVGAHVASRREPWAMPASLAVGNAFAFFSLFAATPHVPDPDRLFLFPAALGALHLGLAAHSRAAGRRPLFVAEVTIGVALAMLSLAVQWAGFVLTAGVAVQAGVLVLLGVWLAEPSLRRLGTAVGALALVRAVGYDPFTAAGATALAVGRVRDAGLLVLAVVAAVCGRALDRAREWDLLEPWERRSPEIARWIALAATALVVALDVPVPWRAAVLAGGTVLLALARPRADAETSRQTAIGAALALGLASFAIPSGEAGIGLLAVVAASVVLDARGAWRGLHRSVGAVAAFAWLLSEPAWPWNAVLTAAAGWLLAAHGRGRALGLVGSAVGLLACSVALGAAGHDLASVARAGVLAAGVAAAYGTYVAHVRRRGELPARASDPVLPDTAVAMLLVAAAMVVAVVGLHRECGVGWAPPAWAGLGLAAVLHGRARALVVGSWAGVVALAFGGGAATLAVLGPARIGWPAVALAAAACALASAALERPGPRALPGPALAGPLAGLALTTVGAAMFGSLRAHWSSLGLGVEGLAVLGLGLALDRPGLRATGAGLLCAVAAKVLLFDVAMLPVQYRIASFLGLGLMLVAAALGYARLRVRTEA